MTVDTAVLAAIDALALPPGARVDARVPKKMLVEQGAPTAADKRAIQDGIDELHWLAACKPATIGVPPFADEVREYLEIAVVACVFRVRAKAARLIELIHRAIPYPVLLMTKDETGLTVSAAHKRRAHNEPERNVIDRIVTVAGLHPGGQQETERRFFQSLGLAQQQRASLWTLYEGWIARIEAMNAARINGSFSALDDPIAIEQRRSALAASNEIMRAIISLKAQIKREKQVARRVTLNIEISRLETLKNDYSKNL